MKRWPGILLLFFAALLVGCGRSHDARVTAELDRADSLLLTSDTAAHRAALRQMLVLDTARALQADEALRARHALLLVQARYKCYVTDPADSVLIATARGYYADHHGSEADHERYTRSLIYSGAVAEETGHPRQALQWYLEAEQAADPADHFNLGFVNLRIGNIYESEYTTDSTDLVRYKQALPHFEKAGSDYYQAVCLTGIGGLYRTHNNDSAMHYLQRAISFSKEHGLTYNYYKSLDKLCGLYYYMEDYAKSKDLAIKIHRENQGEYDDTQYLSFGVRSFAKLGITDSAEYYLKLLPEPKTSVDSMMLHKTFSDIAESKKDYESLILNYRKSNDAAYAIMLHSNVALLKNTEEQYHTKQLKSETEKAKGKVLLLWIVIGVIVILSGYLIFKHYRDKKKLQSLVSQLHDSQAEFDENRSDLLAATKKHDALKALLMRHFQLMDELIRLGESNPNNKLALKLKNEIRTAYSNKHFVNEMRNFVRVHADEVLTDFLASCDNELNTIENDIVTFTACGFSSPEMALLTNQKDASYVRVIQLRIAKKLHLDTTLKVFLSSHFKP